MLNPLFFTPITPPAPHPINFPQQPLIIFLWYVSPTSFQKMKSESTALFFFGKFNFDFPGYLTISEHRDTRIYNIIKSSVILHNELIDCEQIATSIFQVNSRCWLIEPTTLHNWRGVECPWSPMLPEGPRPGSGPEGPDHEIMNPIWKSPIFYWNSGKPRICVFCWICCDFWMTCIVNLWKRDA